MKYIIRTNNKYTHKTFYYCGKGGESNIVEGYSMSEDKSKAVALDYYNAHRLVCLFNKYLNSIDSWSYAEIYAYIRPFDSVNQNKEANFVLH